MTASSSPHPRPAVGLPHVAILGLLVVGVVAVVYLLFGIGDRLDRQEQKITAMEQRLGEILGEMTRFRIEQRAEGQGTDALIEKIATYAPALASASTAGPEFRFARKEMDAILTAVGSLGAAAFEPLRDRLVGLDPTAKFDEQKWLLEACAKADPQKGAVLAMKVLQGYHPDTPVTPRLRWYAGDLLLRLDQPLGQRVLREILSYESGRGIDPQRAQMFGVTAGPMAQNSSGFFNFVAIYLRSEDPQLADTLMMVMGRAEHDLQTVQECVKALGELKEKRAANAIVKLYRNPPVISDNPLFLNHCLDALVKIQGRDAVDFLTAELPKTTNELVANKIKFLLQELGG